MKKQNIRTISLIVVTITYLLFGAALFDYLESTNAHVKSIKLNDIKKDWIGRYNMSEGDFKMLEVVVLRGVPHKAGNQWKFAGAFYYATTVLTTIGYGHSTPKTVSGKVFTMVYAVVGIPLCLVLFHSIGERLNKAFSKVIRVIKRTFKRPTMDVTDGDLILAVTLLSTVTITSGAAVFSSYENWSYFDSVYYCVITLTTIGFGDMVALQKDHTLETQRGYVMFALVFIFLGMAIVAACLNLFVLRLVTLNTEDERRDEAEALQAAAGAVKLEGDVITANGSILSIEDRGAPTSGYPSASGGGTNTIGSLTDLASVCSCDCISCNPFAKPSNLVSRGRYSQRNKPTNLSKLRRQHRRSFSQLSYVSHHNVRQQNASYVGRQFSSGVSQGVTQEEICSLSSSSNNSSILLPVLSSIQDDNKRNSV